MLSSKTISPKNAKLGSMANIANRSPTNRFDNKVSITNNTLSSRKNIVEAPPRQSENANNINSPRKSANTIEKEGTRNA